MLGGLQEIQLTLVQERTDKGKGKEREVVDFLVSGPLPCTGLPISQGQVVEVANWSHW